MGQWRYLETNFEGVEIPRNDDDALNKADFYELYDWSCGPVKMLWHHDIPIAEIEDISKEDLLDLLFYINKRFINKAYFRISILVDEEANKVKGELVLLNASLFDDAISYNWILYELQQIINRYIHYRLENKKPTITYKCVPTDKFIKITY